VLRGILAAIEITVISGLILATRCANYPDVFVGGNIYFVDADSYARMTRVQMCDAKPGLIIRHHGFENFPHGTTPHTTAPLDYLILAVALSLKPFTTDALDFAGAYVSPLLALIGGWFLWWWSGLMKFRYRGVMLILYAISPILVHGTELGRPDHQSLSILLMTIAICAEFSLQNLQANCSGENLDSPRGLETTAAGAQIDAIRDSRISSRLRRWAFISAAAWGLAIWVSAYEPLVLFIIVIIAVFLLNRRALFARERGGGWILFAAILVIALLTERRIPSLSIFHSNAIFRNWSRTIGELVPVSPANPVWLHWCGYLLLMTPFLILVNIRTRGNRAPLDRALPIYVVLIATYLLTIWQARWAYFFGLIFAIALPVLLARIKSPSAVWIAFALSLFPILGDWDERLWPNETQLAGRIERRTESMQLRALALRLRSHDVHPFLAPWWLSPSIAYWSGQPGVAGSSHESLNGIEDSARFFLSEDLQQEREILQSHDVVWVCAYDFERVAQNSAAILNEPLPVNPLCRVLDRTPGQAPRFLIFSAQTAAFKLYRSLLNDKNEQKVSITNENPLTGTSECHNLPNAQEIRPAKADAAGSRRAAVSGYR
jgi:hypothetical protein